MTVAGASNDDVLTALRAVLMGLLGSSVEIIAAQDNYVPEPKGPDFVVMTPTTRMRLSTNWTSYADASGAGARTSLQPTQVTVQLDVHGPASADSVQTISTALRDDSGVQAFRATGLPVSPLYADDPVQAPFLAGEGTYETRYTLDVVLQVASGVTWPQAFAGTLTLAGNRADGPTP